MRCNRPEAESAAPEPLENERGLAGRGFHNHAAQQLVIRLTLHQQSANQPDAGMASARLKNRYGLVASHRYLGF
jgi:hypothetical protein